MWLDRFSQQSTPSGTPQQSRLGTPAPRRSGLSPGPLPSRPGINPRSTSLSTLASPTSSTTSLPATARIPNGSALRNEISIPVPVNVPHPLQVLSDTLGKSRRSARKDVLEDGGPVRKPSEVVEEIKFDGLSLEAFAAEKPKAHTEDVHKYSSQSIEEYDKEKNKFEDLHKSILACDDVLESVETYLTGFQTDLAAVSAEIETLQSRSTALNTKLENRKVVEKLLGPAVEDISIAPAVVRRISEGPMDQDFANALSELEKREKAVAAKAKETQGVKALDDIKPLLQSLSNRAIERIRDYLVSTIKSLRSPSINAQHIQTTSLLPNASLFAFLAKRQPQLADEIIQAYVNTMKWYYSSHFSRYKTALEKLRIHHIDKTHLLASDDGKKSSTPAAAGILANARGGSLQPADPFVLGRRIDLLKRPSSTALPAHIAEEDKLAHYLETPFRSFNHALTDNISFEYTFLSTLLSPHSSFSSISRTFTSIFAPTFTLGQDLTRALIADPCSDALGILLCVRLNQSFAFELQRRKVPAGEGYMNATAMLLWPRFQQVLDLHCTSLQQSATKLPGRPSGATALLNAGSAGSVAPHPLTQRFANFLSGILALSSEARGDDEPVGRGLDRLRGEYEAWVVKLSKSVGDARKRERFLVNNFSLVGTILEDMEGVLAEEAKDRFATLVKEHEKA